MKIIMKNSSSIHLCKTYPQVPDMKNTKYKKCLGKISVSVNLHLSNIDAQVIKS